MAKAPRPTKKKRRRKPELNEGDTDPTTIPEVEDEVDVEEEETEDTPAEETPAEEEASEEVQDEAEGEPEAADGVEEDTEPAEPATGGAVDPLAEQKEVFDPEIPAGIVEEVKKEAAVELNDVFKGAIADMDVVMDADLAAIGGYGIVTVVDFLSITKRESDDGPGAKIALDRYVEAGLVERNWFESSGRYSLTDAGKAHVAALS